MEETEGLRGRPGRQGQPHGPDNPGRHREGQGGHAEVDEQTVPEGPEAMAQGKERLEQQQKQETYQEHGHEFHTAVCLALTARRLRHVTWTPPLPYSQSNAGRRAGGDGPVPRRKPRRSSWAAPSPASD